MAASWIPPRGATEYRGGPSGELSRVAPLSAGGPRTCGPGGAGQAWCRRRSRPRPRPRSRPARAARSAEEGSEDHPQFLRCGHDQVPDRKPPDCERHAPNRTRPAVPGSTRRRALGRGNARARPATAGGVGGVGLTRCRRAWRFGRLTSTTSTFAPASGEPGPIGAGLLHAHRGARTERAQPAEKARHALGGGPDRGSCPRR
jgi:hypothetical protein